MADNPIGRVFDDENDRWIAVLPGETDRDALLRARNEGAASVLPPQGASRVTGGTSHANRPLKTLKVVGASTLSVGILVWLMATLSLYAPYSSLDAVLNSSVASAIGSTLIVVGCVATLLALAAAAIIEGVASPRD